MEIKSISRFLNLALLVTYFGDYCSLIGIMEFAKVFGSSDKVVLIFTIYCLPPLIMSFVANKWAQHQQMPNKQIALFSAAGAIGGLSLLHTLSYWHVLVIVLLLGFVKEATQLLVNVYVKFNFSEEDSKKAVNNIVTSRFFIMVFGGSLGAYLGEIHRYDLIFITDALTFLIAGVIFYFLKSKTFVVPQNGQTTSTSFWLGMRELIIVFESASFLWVTLAAMGIGSFMALEYPLITTEFAISPRLMGFIYFWHVLGALLARRIGKELLHRDNIPKLIILFSCLLIGSFGLVGIFGTNLMIVGVQIGFIALLMVIGEVLSNFYLMKKSSKEIYLSK